jgi:hypothetical protein
MFDVLRRYREMRPASVLVIFAALMFCGYNVHRALGFGSHAEQASLAAVKLPLSGDINLDQFGDPVLTKVDASTLKSVEKLTRIEDLQVGERIRSDAPTEEFDLQFGTDIIRSDWRKVTLVAPKRDGSSADVVLLRPLQWLNDQQAEVGGTVFISVPECGIDGHANVLAIDPCPPIEPAGDLGGRIITGTFRHQVSASISLSIAGQAEPILCTGNHPFWSEDRHDFVRADSLQPNETLRTTSGSTIVTSLTHIPGSTPVYNLEIHGTHVYHVGTSGVLVHNGDPEDCIKFAERLAAEIGGTPISIVPKAGNRMIGHLPEYPANKWMTSGMWQVHAIVRVKDLVFDPVFKDGVNFTTWLQMNMKLTLTRIDDRVNAIAITKLIRDATGQNLFVAKSLAEDLLLGRDASVELKDSVDAIVFSGAIENFGIRAIPATGLNG